MRGFGLLPIFLIVAALGAISMFVGPFTWDL